MSTILDNEVWNPDPKIGSVEEGGDGSHQYQDYQLSHIQMLYGRPPNYQIRKNFEDRHFPLLYLQIYEQQ